MDVLTGAFHVLATVVAVGGVAKVMSPDAFTSLLRSLRLPHRPVFARGAGVLEIALGGVAVIVGGRVASAAIALAYLLFTVSVVQARRAGATSCGCFGAAAAPPGPVHVAVNAASALVATAATVAGAAAPLTDVLADQPAAGVPYLLSVATGALLIVTLDTVGAVVFDRAAAVSRLGPTFRDNARGTHGPHRHAPANGGRR